MQALVLEATNTPFVLKDNFPIPQPSTGQVLVKISAIGLNPVDWKQQKYGFLIHSFPIVLGCDLAGTIQSVGPGVTDFGVGDEIYSFTPLGTPGCGAFAQYALVDVRTAAKKPSNITAEQAATVPVGALTAALGLFHHFGLEVPQATVAAKGQNVLVWGASSAVGVFAVQLAKLAGYAVTGVCSARNFEYVKSLGADHVVDYNSSSVVDDIKAIGSFQYAYDAIGDASATTSSQVLASGGHLISCATSPGYKPPREDIKFDSVFTGGAYLTQGVELQKLCEYAQVVRGLLESGKLQPLNVKRLEGLASVVQGLELLEQGKVSAAKVVVVPEQ